jgi:predicted PurR-regulated permease PerM
MVGLDVDRSRAVWWGTGGVLFAVVLFILYSFVGTFVFGLFIYYATRPVYRRIRRRLRQRSLSAALSLVVFALPALLLLSYTVAIGLQELARLQSVSLGPLSSVVDPYLDISELVDDPAGLLQDSASVSALRNALFSALDYLGFIGNGLLHLFVMFAFAFYLLRDGPRLSRWFVKFGDERGVLDTYVNAVDRSLSNIFFGNILNAIMTGAIGAISFSLLNLFAPTGLEIPYPALTGLLAGVASLIPIVGMKLVYVPVLGYLGVKAALDGTGFAFVIAFFAISFVIVDTLPDLVLRPYVSGRNLHVGLVMFAYILGPLMFGWYGIFLGPIILVLVIHFGRIVLPELLSGTTIKPGAVDPGALMQPDTPPDPVNDSDVIDPTTPESPPPDEDD